MARTNPIDVRKGATGEGAAASPMPHPPRHDACARSFLAATQASRPGLRLGGHEAGTRGGAGVVELPPLTPGSGLCDPLRGSSEGEPRPPVDMSPAAIARRLREVDMLYALNRDALSRLRIVPRGEDDAVARRHAEFREQQEREKRAFIAAHAKDPQP